MRTETICFYSSPVVLAGPVGSCNHALSLFNGNLTFMASKGSPLGRTKDVGHVNTALLHAPICFYNRNTDPTMGLSLM